MVRLESITSTKAPFAARQAVERLISVCLWCRTDLFESVVNKTGMGYMYRNGQEKNRLIYARWFLTLLTGVVTALTAVFLLYCTTLLMSLKKHLLEYSIHHELEKNVPFGTAFWSIVAFNAGLVVIAATITVFYEPVAAGSGAFVLFISAIPS